jgi:hypothetical protein
MELNKRIRNIPIPDRMKALPLSSEGYPTPYFVPFIDGEPEFRGMDGEKFNHCIRNRRCWLCGQQLGKHLTFPIGPMCAITRTTAEPPSHLACSEYGVRACPFLTQPRMRRNEKDLPEEPHSAGIALKRNPGVIVLWTTLSFKLFKSGGVLFRVGEPEHVEVYTQGRRATRAELMESIDAPDGYAELEKLAKLDGPDAELELVAYRATAMKVFEANHI